MFKYISIFVVNFLFFSISLIAQEEVVQEETKPEEPSKLQFTFTPSLGGTYTATSAPPNEKENLEWLSQLQTALNYEGGNFNFDTDLFLQYGQIHPLHEMPSKTQDDFILNVMPSYQILTTPSLRIFLQVKAESKLAEGVIDTQKTYFLDPLFLTNSIFFGEKKYIIKDKDGGKFLITYGVGYSQQMIIKNKFKLVSETEHHSDPEYVGGLSAILNVEFLKELFEGFNLNISFKSMAIAKNKIYSDIENFRYSSILVSSLEFGMLSINYTNRLVYDNEVSKTRSLSQSFTLGLKYNL
jgi:hypothetical protein